MAGVTTATLYDDDATFVVKPGFVRKLVKYTASYTVNMYSLTTFIATSHNRASRDCGSTVNTTIYPKGYAQSKCVSYIVTMRAGEG